MGTITDPKQSRGGFPVPGRLIDYVEEELLHLIQFHPVARVHIFQGEDDHTGGGAVGDADDHDLAHSSPRQYSMSGTLYLVFWVEVSTHRIPGWG